MINYKTGDLLNEQTDAIVNTVNCVGIMGKGIALQFKKRWPENFSLYELACKRNEVVPGKMFIFTTGTFSNPKFIINFPTKRHWKGKSRIEDIKSGLVDLVQIIKKLEIKSISLPPLGCGLGGLEWDEVKPIIENAFSSVPEVECVVYLPKETNPSEENFKNKIAPKMTNGRAALVYLINQYLKAGLDPFITLLEIHKLMYLLQESGENLRLSYSKEYFGPYCSNLRHVLIEIEGYLIKGYDGSDKPDKEINLVPGSFEESLTLIEQSPSLKSHITDVMKFVDGFESSFGLELLSTVHWLVFHENVKTYPEVVSKVHEWNKRKKEIFNEFHIQKAYDRVISTRT